MGGPWWTCQDGERCSIALELGEWATLRGLQLLCRGQAGHPMGRPE